MIIQKTIYRIILAVFFVFYVNNAIYAEEHPPIYVSNMLDAIALSDDIDHDVLLIFSASWCGACQDMKKDIINDKSGILNNHIICYIEYDENQALIKEYKVRKIPDYLIIRKRKEIKRKVGYKGFIEFSKWIKNE